VPPTLDWAGEPGYLTDGLEPETADAGLPFRWKISYTDPDDNPPALGQPRVSIYRDGSPIPGSPYAMSGADGMDTVYSDGKTYVVTVILAQCGGTYTYTFTAKDSRGAPAVATLSGSGPVVTCPNFPPTLSNAGVSPTSAPSGTAFTYRVLYADPEGVGPAVIDVRVRLDGRDVATQSLLFAGWYGGPTYVEGAWFDGTVLLVNESSNYTFRFRASDGTTLVTTPDFLGPQVAPPPPDTLHVSGYQLFPPLFVDEGTREVPFLHLALWTTDPDVNVTSVQINRICGGPDGAIESILLYWDVDTSNSVSPPDQLLGMQPPLFANVFPLAPALNVTPSSSFDLLVVANVARPGIADATIGFQVPDASAIGVEPGDTVQPFGAISSDCASVNVAPRARNPTMDGHLSGTPPADHLLTATPPLGWVFEDDNSGDVVQAAYNVSVHTVSPSTLLWFRNETADVRSLPYGGPPLAIGTTYEVQVRVYDGRLWSLTATGTFRRNTPPAAPILASPPDLALDVDPSVTLTWSAIADAEGDPVAYTWWVSDSPAFTPATSGITTAANVPLSLQRSTQYYWKVGASDGYEFSGNATIWRFATAAEPVPVRGEARGRVVNGTAPIAGALVELLNGTEVVAARITPPNGTFAIGDLDLLAYGVRVSAFGFHPRTLAAEPTQAAPVVDLSDIALTPITNGNGGNHEPPPVAWLPIAIPLALAVAALLAFLLVFRRRRSRKPRDTLAVEASLPDGPAAQPPPLAVTIVIPRDADEPIRMSVPEEPEAPPPAAEGRRSEPPTGEELAFECPVCGRRVAADALACVCGAVFEA
jgi:hypothetical protein